MLVSMHEVGCDLLRIASLALAARGFEALGQNFLHLGMELVDGGSHSEIEMLN
jgi:hypothetical protein